MPGLLRFRRGLRWAPPLHFGAWRGRPRLNATVPLGAQGIVVLDNARQHALAYHIGFCLMADRAIRRVLQALGVIEDFAFCDHTYD